MIAAASRRPVATDSLTKHWLSPEEPPSDKEVPDVAEQSFSKGLSTRSEQYQQDEYI